MKRFINRAGIGILCAAAFAGAAQANECKLYPEITRFRYPLARLAKKLLNNQPIKIVALGSSSTAGAFASGPDKAYPARLEVHLREYFPKADITVVNLGRNGDTADLMYERLKASPQAQDADMIAFQGGVNSVLRGLPAKAPIESVRAIIDFARHHDPRHPMDIVMINAQATPQVDTKPGLSEMLAGMRNLAQEMKVNLFDRHTLMDRFWRANGEQLKMSIAADGLHMNDTGYNCWALTLAEAIRQAASPRTMALGQAARP